ncbi:MAG: ribonuclease H-like domain-containing protein [bacterium]
MQLRDKLRQLEKLPYPKHTDTRETRSQDRSNIGEVVEGEFRQSHFGTYFVREKTFPLEHCQGTVQLSSFLDYPSGLFTLLAKNMQLADIDPKRALFIDTETTGLSGGTGTLAFLIGIGYFSTDGFRLLQFFVHDLNAEKAILHRINEIVAACDLAVSYNGKCFDFPLLIARNILYRLSTPLTKVQHLDLLFTVRRLWRHRLPDCTLNTAQKHLLKAPRIGDVLGYAIPELYFRYFRTKDARPLQAVFYHNEQDILTLAALGTKACQLFESPLEESQNGQDILALGKVYENLALHERSIELYRQYLNTPGRLDQRRDLLLRLALNHKKLNQYQQAQHAWQTCIDSEHFHPQPYIELAKIFEHQEKDYKKALSYVDRALKEMASIEALRERQSWVDYKNDLIHRRRRLKRQTD